jgi:hypothetical protein
MRMKGRVGFHRAILLVNDSLRATALWVAAALAYGSALERPWFIAFGSEIYQLVA